MSRLHSAVSVGTRLTDDRLGGAASFLFNYYRVFTGIKRPGRDVDHSPPSSADVMSGWSRAFTAPLCLHSVDRDKAIYSILQNVNVKINASALLLAVAVYLSLAVPLYLSLDVPVYLSLAVPVYVSGCTGISVSGCTGICL
jgi:hypothetical protein